MRVGCRLLAVPALAVVLAGCQKKEHAAAVSPARVHAITREMLRAARSVLRDNGAAESQLQFDGVHDNRADQVMITTRDQSSRQQTELIQSLDRVATANSLTRDAEIGHDGPVRLAYRDGRVLTHSIEIGSLPSSALFPHHRGTPRLAVILDDVGSDRSAAKAIFNLHYPLTISILPNHSHSTEIAREAQQRGYQVMLHLPMQALTNEKRESQELRAGMSARDIRFLIDKFLETVPDASGANNHQGSESTADVALMQKLMPILRDHHLYYVDSRTTAATVAFDTAQSFGLHAAFRNVPFLDDVSELRAVRKQLELAFRAARDRGEAVAIGHPHQATLAALEEMLPQAAAQGVQLVFVSDGVH
jgi:polysaccharide deacetylase 2 family uncharacterized protein YibQ